MAEVLQALPDLAVLPASHAHRERVAGLAASLRDVIFAVPAGFDEMRLHIFGLGAGEPLPFARDARRALVVSPFLRSDTLDRLPVAWAGLTVVSRADEIDRELHSLAHTDNEPTTLEINPRVVPDSISGSPDLSGLHAKLYVLDTPGARTQVLTGSANATQRAFGGNVEALLELVGPTAKVGVKQWLDGDDCLGKMLVPHIWSTARDGAAESTEEGPLDALRRAVASVPITATFTTLSGGRSEVRYVARRALPDLAGAQLRVRPTSIAAWSEVIGHALDVTARVDLLSLTSFLGARLELGGHACEFVLATELVGAPQDRQARVIAALLGDPRRLVRFLLLLLTDQRVDRFDGRTQQALEYLRTDRVLGVATVPLLEVMVRALANGHRRLADIDKLLMEVAGASELIDDDLRSLWNSIRQAAGLEAAQ